MACRRQNRCYEHAFLEFPIETIDGVGPHSASLALPVIIEKQIDLPRVRRRQIAECYADAHNLGARVGDADAGTDLSAR
jgi:hypothetical protein